MQIIKPTRENKLDAYREYKRKKSSQTNGATCPYCFSSDIALKRYVDIDDLGNDAEVYECSNCGANSYF